MQVLLFAFLLLLTLTVQAEYLGNLSANEFGPYGNPYSPTNPYGSCWRIEGR